MPCRAMTCRQTSNSPAALKELAPPEILELLKPVVVSDYTTLPASMQTAAYDIHTIPRFKYPCALPALPLETGGWQ